jgi:hypothetical protein
MASIVLKPAHFAERLLHTKFAAKRDTLRMRSGFSEDLQAVNVLLNNPKVKKTTKIAAYRKWLLDGQPCIFGRTAARGRGVFICLLDEKQVLTDVPPGMIPVLMS